MTVSRRNLVSLLHKLGEPTPLGMAVSLNAFGKPADDVVLVLQVENDGLAWEGRRSGGPRLHALLAWLFDGKENG